MMFDVTAIATVLTALVMGALFGFPAILEIFTNPER